jgi:hypothetical protein
VSCFDITDRYVLDQALHDEVLTDPLTGLANRFAAPPVLLYGQAHGGRRTPSPR